MSARCCICADLAVWWSENGNGYCPEHHPDHWPPAPRLVDPGPKANEPRHALALEWEPTYDVTGGI
jgi:hypothetical protein